VKLLVAALTPIIVAAVGYWLNQRLKSLEAVQWSQQKIVERRIRAYDDLAPGLNQLFCFFAYVGTWKETSPPEVVALKRSLDRCAHISAAAFDPRFLKLYNDLIDLCFIAFHRWGEDAKLRTMFYRRKEALGEHWQPGWEACFASGDDVVAPSKMKDAYVALMA